MITKAHLLSALLTLTLTCSSALAKDNRIDFARYRKQVKPIVQAMTLDEKLGQMTLAKFTAIQSSQGVIDYTRITQHHLGALLAAGGEMPTGKGGVVAATYDPRDYLKATQANWRQLIKQIKKKNKAIPVVTVLFSGRPMIINQPEGALEKSAAFIAAWLPGTSGGQALAQSLFGDYLFCYGKTKKRSATCKTGSPNMLSMNWVQSMASLRNYPIYTKGKGFVAYQNPLYRIGYGLATQ